MDSDQKVNSMQLIEVHIPAKLTNITLCFSMPFILIFSFAIASVMQPQQQINPVYIELLGGPPKEKQVLLSRIKQQSLKKHFIEIRNRELIDRNPFHIDLHSVTHQGRLATFQVTLNDFIVTLRVLNLNVTMQRNKSKEQARGAFGSVYKQSLFGRNFVCKLQFFNSSVTRINIDNVLKEAAMMKICSLLKIGPAAFTQFPFDLVIFTNAIQFHMEQCIKLDLANSDRAKQVKQSLRTLHTFQLVHGDVKSRNILYSKTHEKGVLCDFRESRYIREEFGEKTKTKATGTQFYRCPEMKKLRGDTEQKVDLYYNDAYGLKISIQQSLERQQKEIEESQMNLYPIGTLYDFSEVLWVSNGLSFQNQITKETNSDFQSMPLNNPTHQQPNFEFLMMYYWAAEVGATFPIQGYQNKLENKEMQYVIKTLIEMRNRQKLQELLQILTDYPAEQKAIREWFNNPNHPEVIHQKQVITARQARLYPRLMRNRMYFETISQGQPISSQFKKQLNSQFSITIDDNIIQSVYGCDGKYSSDLTLFKDNHMFFSITQQYHILWDFMDIIHSANPQKNDIGYFNLLTTKKISTEQIEKFTRSKQPQIRKLVILSILDSLTELIIGKGQLGDKSAEICSKRLEGLKILDISWNLLEQSGAAHISRLTNLTTLNISRNCLSENGAAHISKMTNLTNLDIGSNQLSNIGAAHISKMTNLTTLNIRGDFLGDDGAFYLSKLTNLTTLSIGKNQIRDDGAFCISTLTNLTNLDISQTKLSDIGAADISKLINLTNLDIRQNELKDNGAAHISKLINLTTLNISYNKLSDIGAAHISKLTNLTNLDIRKNELKDNGAAHISKLINLTDLDIGSNQLSDIGAAHISKLTNLTKLLIYSNQISGDGAAHISKLINLTKLLIYSNQLSDIGAAHISKLTNLTILSISENELKDNGAAHISKLTNLTTLDIDSNILSDIGAAHISKLTNLTNLDISKNELKDNGAAHISKLTNLTLLSIWNNGLKRQQGESLIRKHLPQCDILL